MNRRKCANKICDNLSRNYENRFCCIECADLHNGIIDLNTYHHLIEYKTALDRPKLDEI